MGRALRQEVRRWAAVSCRLLRVERFSGGLVYGSVYVCVVAQAGMLHCDVHDVLYVMHATRLW